MADQGSLSPSDGLADAVERAGTSVVKIDARRRQSASGVIWSDAGLIVTADHVLEREEDVTVGLADGRSASASIVGRDSGTDVALLRVDASALRSIERGPAPRIGHLTLVVARPGESVEASLGTVSALLGPVRTWRGRLSGLIRTDVVMFPGFSGGALIDAAGRMVGLASSHFARGTGMAIPVGAVEEVVSSLQSHGRVRRGFLGLSSQPVALPEALRSRLGLDQDSGLLVVGVENGGPAEQGGMMIGDILVSLGSQPVRNTEDLRAFLGPESVGQSAPARVIRGGDLREVTVTVGERA